MGYCFNCIAKDRGDKDAISMFSKMEKSLSPQEIANELSVDIGTVKYQMKKLRLWRINTWGGRNVKINGKFVRVESCH